MALSGEPELATNTADASDVGDTSATAQRRQPGTGDSDDGSTSDGRGQQPPRPAGVEPPSRDPAGRGALADQQAGDQEAREDEEDVHADEAAGDPGQAGMEREDERGPRRARRPSRSGRKPSLCLGWVVATGVAASRDRGPGILGDGVGDGGFGRGGRPG